MNKPSIWKGLVAGIAGGLVASWAMGQAHAAISKVIGAPASPSSEGEDSTVRVARAVWRPILHRGLTPVEAMRAGPIVHYAFGSSVAALYGAAAELQPAFTRGAGLPFGAAVWLGAHVIVTPALGLSPTVTQSNGPSEAAEFGAHLVYGSVTELVRRGMRRLLGR